MKIEMTKAEFFCFAINCKETDCTRCVLRDACDLDGKCLADLVTIIPDETTAKQTENPARTNFDKVKAMTLEDLAYFKTGIECPPNKVNGPCIADCEVCWLRWLKEEVDGE